MTDGEVVSHPADSWREDLRGRLLTARKERGAVRVSALRTALSAIDNAETPGVDPIDAKEGPIAGAVQGLGAAEVARRRLTDTELRAVVQAEVDERLAAAEQMAAGGHDERADAVRAEAAVIAEVLAAR